MIPFHKIKQDQNRNNILLNTVSSLCNLKNDAALSRALEVAPPVISKIRNNKLQIGPTMLIKLHEISDLSVPALKLMLVKS